MKIGIASDHRGYLLKEKIKEALASEYSFEDFGTDSTDSVDYPDYAFKLGEYVALGNMGIAICGSGIGISIAMNKVKGVRCALLREIEEAKTTRIDNDSNALAISGSMDLDNALAIIRTFMNTKHPACERHDRRIKKIKDYEDLC